MGKSYSHGFPKSIRKMPRISKKVVEDLRLAKPCTILPNLDVQQQGNRDVSRFSGCNLASEMVSCDGGWFAANFASGNCSEAQEGILEHGE